MKDCHCRRRISTAIALCFGVIVFSGCPSQKPENNENASESPSEGQAAASAEKEPLLEPFDPPTLEELNAKVEWEDRPVIDPMDRYIKYKKEHPAEVSVADALKIRNKTDADNEKILTTLGQPPASEDEVDYEAQANRHTPMDLKSTNPIMISSVAEFALLDLTGAGIIANDWDLIPFGDANFVKSWQSSKDRLYDKIVLRDDLVWSDGKPITAHDIEFSFQVIMTPEVPIPAVRSGVSELKWVTAYDDHTVVYFHKESLASNTENISFPIIPKHIYEHSVKEDPTLVTSPYHRKYEETPVSGGPYQLVKRTRGSELLLKRRESWYMKDGKQVRRKPYFKEVRFRIIEDPNTALLALKNGEIDELQLRPEQWVTQTDDDEFYSKNTKAHGVEWSFSYIGWNVGDPVPFFKDKRVRQAMAYTLDHKEMLKNILFGLYQTGQGIYHPNSWMAPKPMPKPYPQDLDKAEDLLDDAGWGDSNGDGIRDKEINGRLVNFDFTLIVPSGSETGLKIAELFKQNLDQIGIICNIKPTEFTVMQEIARTHKFQAMMAGWGTGSDPASGKNLWTTKALKQDGRNYSQYSNPEVDKLFVEGEHTFDRAERAKIYAKIHNILWEDQPYLWLYYRSSYYGFSKDWRGYQFSPRDPFGYSPGFQAIWKPKK